MRLLFKIILTLAGFVIGCAVAQARIGETEKQCEERYGKPIQTDKEDSIHIYRKGEFVVAAQFHEGKCDYIVFHKRREDGLGERPERAAESQWRR